MLEVLQPGTYGRLDLEKPAASLTTHLRPQLELQREASLVYMIILGVTMHSRVSLRVRLRPIKISSKCDFVDIHQGIVWVLLIAISGESFFGQKMFPQGYLSANRYTGRSGELRILHFVVDVYRDVRYCNKDPRPRRRYSEGQVCHNKEFEIGHPLFNQTMSIPEDVYWVRKG